MAHFLTDPQYRALTAVCEALIPAVDRADDPAGFWRRAAPDLDIPRLVTRAVRDWQGAEQQRELKQLLDLLSGPAGTGGLTGQFRAFAELSLAARERALQAWAVSPLPPLRRAFQGLKRLTTALFYTALDETGRNPNWEALDYPGPRLPVGPPPAKRLQPLAVTADTTLTCDVVVVGSGAGGGVAAGELARAGYDVIVLEKGGYFAAEDFDGVEFTAYQRLYENQAVLATRDLGVIVLAGSALGGGTLINWGASFRTPEHVRVEWEREHGCDGLTGAEFTAALDAVTARLGVNTEAAWPSPEAGLLERACDRLGLGCGVIPINTPACADPALCGWCAFGCAAGRKQSTLETYLADAAEHGARIVVGAEARRVLLDGRRAAGVEAGVGAHTLTVKARVVVAAAGALHTPALLLRSGLGNPNIGRHLRLHPTVAVVGDYPEAVEPWRGPLLTRYVNQWADLDGRHYGVVIEHAPAHPGLIGLGTVWRSGEQHKQAMRRAQHSAFFIAITRDRAGGRVTLDRQGRPVLNYQLSAADGRHLLRGLQAGFQLHAAAGATEISGPHSGLAPFQPAGGGLERYFQQVARAGLDANRLTIFSAHQMGACRMGGRRAAAALTPQAESWDVSNLFVADASVFPTASGVNPMITIMALAHRTAQVVKTRLP